ncbi:VAN3-binding protein [Cornus florida]|uniref:VAN3-binding protein n=1 Tax=Cornus florida TaxID=4283 RepID=UPI00289A91D3|nr:VAN3-binding protein [Cornus florida]
MDSSADLKATVSEAHPETMDFLSRAWCNLAVEAFQPAELQDSSLLRLHHNLIITKFDKHHTKSPLPNIMDNTVKMGDADRSIPPWKSNDVKSWIWMQQAMHPELNYNTCFRKKWLPWKTVSFRHMMSIKKWLKEMKQKRKEDERLKRAEVHAAISVAGVAAALAAIAAENSSSSSKLVLDDSTTKESTVASAAALVAAQCAQVAEALGAKKEQLSTVIGSAMSCTTAGDILTLTAAAATSLRGAATLKARSGCNNRLINGSVPVLPIQDNDHFDFNFDKCRSILAKGTELSIQTSDNGRCMLRSVSVTLTREAKVILKIRKLNLLNAFARNKESTVLDLHAELYKEEDSQGEESEEDTCYLIVLTTNGGMIKLDMGDDYRRYKLWATTINQMLMLSTSFTSYHHQQLQFFNT